MTTRPLADRCPGLLRTFPAEDGALVRVRVPGGRVAAATLVALVQAVSGVGAPFVQLTSRGNLQLRGLPDQLPQGFIDLVSGLGLLPHPSHERIRNLLASPWSRHAAEISSVVAEVDSALCVDATLTRLPGRFLLVVDDGTGHLLDQPYDLGYQRISATEGLLLGTGGRARRIRRSQVAPEIVSRATTFVAEREAMAEPAWNIDELGPDATALAGLDGVAPVATSTPPAGECGGDLVVAVPLGLLTADQVMALAGATDEVVLTPWRKLVLPGATALDTTRLTNAGLVVEPSGWDRVTACIGAPFCRRTDVDTRALARQLAQQLTPTSRPVHVSGCERRCGAPRYDHGDLVAPTFDDARKAMTSA